MHKVVTKRGVRCPNSDSHDGCLQVMMDIGQNVAATTVQRSFGPGVELLVGSGMPNLESPRDELYPQFRADRHQDKSLMMARQALRLHQQSERAS